MALFKRISGFFLDIIETIVIALALFVLVYLFLFQPHQVRGSSMFPSFHDQEYILTDKISYRLNEPQRGDVIIFKAPQHKEYDYIKRIIGLPGEMVRVENCHIFIDGTILKEDYLPEDLCTNTGSYWRAGQNILLPEDEYFVAGDNRPYSSDSRDWGMVPEENITGRASFRYWPPDKIGVIRGIDY